MHRILPGFKGYNSSPFRDTLPCGSTSSAQKTLSLQLAEIENSA